MNMAVVIPSLNPSPVQNKKENKKGGTLG